MYSRYAAFKILTLNPFTPLGLLINCSWGLCSMSRLIYVVFVADLVACRLKFFHECFVCRPESNSEAK